MSLDDYVIDDGPAVGQGQFGIVYSAWSKTLGRKVAVKEVLLSKGEEMIEAEMNGTRKQRIFAASHKGFVPEVFEDGKTDRAYFIAMELVEGGPLEKLIGDSALDYRRSAEIAAVVADFLQKAHAINVFHSDLKPKNILVRPDWGVRIIDFGITTETKPGKTSATNQFRSQNWASPERLRTGRVDRQSELWSLAVILFEMVSGRHPYAHLSSAAELEDAVREGRPMGALPADCPEDLRAVIAKALSRQPELRYASPADFLADLQCFLNGRPTVAGDELRRAGEATLPVPGAKAAPPPSSTGFERTGSGSEGAGSTREPSPEEPVGPVAPERRKRSFGRVVLRLATVAIFLALVLSEGAAWIRAQRLYRRIPTVECGDVNGVRSEIEQTHRWTPIAFALSWRVFPAIKARMVELADRVIKDYRNDLPAVTELSWRRAGSCIALAADVAPDDVRVESRRKTIAGHIRRITAKDTGDQQEAIRDFREAAGLDPATFDPYLGLARIHTYQIKDLNALEEDIHNAERLGFVTGKRERAQLGEGFRFRADSYRLAARKLTGAEQRRQLELALSDYKGCIAKLTELHFAQSETALGICKKSLEELETVLGLPGR